MEEDVLIKSLVQIEKFKNDITVQNCSICKEEKPISEFNKTRTGRFTKGCTICLKERKKKRITKGDTKDPDYLDWATIKSIGDNKVTKLCYAALWISYIKGPKHQYYFMKSLEDYDTVLYHKVYADLNKMVTGPANGSAAIEAIQLFSTGYYLSNTQNGYDGIKKTGRKKRFAECKSQYLVLIDNILDQEPKTRKKLIGIGSYKNLNEEIIQKHIDNDVTVYQSILMDNKLIATFEFEFKVIASRLRDTVAKGLQKNTFSFSDYGDKCKLKFVNPDWVLYTEHIRDDIVNFIWKQMNKTKGYNAFDYSNNLINDTLNFKKFIKSLEK